MCTLVLALRAHDAYPLVLAANRDEFFARPAAAAAFWPDRPSILAGRDLLAGGTWLGVRVDGRFGVLTNIRDATDPVHDRPSRGEIIPAYLGSGEDAMPFALQLAEVAHQYDGFNLIIGDTSHVVYYSNREAAPRALAPGIYGLSNAVLGTDWPKVRRAVQLLEKRLASTTFGPDALLQLLSDAERPDDASLPDTGEGIEWNRMLSSIFIDAPHYGTRASTVFLIDRARRAQFVERRRLTGSEENVNRYAFQLED